MVAVISVTRKPSPQRNRPPVLGAYDLLVVADAQLTLHLTRCASYVPICVMQNQVPLQPSTRLSHQLRFSIVNMIARITSYVACSKVLEDEDLYVLEIVNIYNEVARTPRPNSDVSIARCS